MLNYSHHSINHLACVTISLSTEVVSDTREGNLNVALILVLSVCFNYEAQTALRVLRGVTSTFLSKGNVYIEVEVGQWGC